MCDARKLSEAAATTRISYHNTFNLQNGLQLHGRHACQERCLNTVVFIEIAPSWSYAVGRQQRLIERRGDRCAR